jgi:hypothetical protein
MERVFVPRRKPGFKVLGGVRTDFWPQPALPLAQI